MSEAHEEFKRQYNRMRMETLSELTKEIGFLRSRLIDTEDKLAQLEREHRSLQLKYKSQGRALDKALTDLQGEQHASQGK